MSNYPFSQDNDTTLPPVSGSTQEDIAITALRSAVFAIEKELGIKPSGIYPDVRTRLDILESRINFSVPPNVNNDGYVRSPLILWNTVAQVAMSISDGYGAPTENRVSGSLYMRADGYLNNQLYVNVGPADGYSTLWKPVQTDQWVASGDLTGTYLKQTVVGLDGYPLDTSVMSHMDGYSDGYNLTWNFGTGKWTPSYGFKATHDLAPAPGSGPTFTLFGNSGRTAQTVVGLQDHSLSADLKTIGSLNDGYALIWENTDNHWDSQPLPIVWHNSVTNSPTSDGYVTRTNIRSNRLKQSTSQSNAGRVGMTNFGSSTLSIGGATADYATILGGDNHTASGAYAAIVGGALNSVTDGYALVVDGYNNSAGGQFSTVLNGKINTITVNGVQSFILDGYNHTISGFNSFILDGYNNLIGSSYSGILNGQNNSISNSANTHAWIGFGSSNTITGAAATYSMILGGSGNTLSAQNIFIGNPTGANAQSNYDAIVSGLNNTIGTSSTFATILGGNTNVINNSSGFSFIGTGNNITTTGLYSTVLNATVATANGLHTTVLNGNTNSVTATFSTIGNGNNNTISGNPAYATILDGYSNLITSSGGLILDGYNNTISGFYSSILNGNNNSISSLNSTILNGSSNTMDSASPNNVVLFGTANTFTSSTRVMAAGNGNIFNNATNVFVLGQFNNQIQGSSIKITGDSNTTGSGSSFVRIYGNSNNVATGITQSTIFGSSNNLINSTHDNAILGSTNIVDGYGNSAILGANNIANANFSFVQGQFGKSKMFGQQVHANSRFNAGRIGEAQWSRLVLTGNGGPGASFLVQLQDTSPANMTFQDGYAYELNIRVVIASVTPATPVATARFTLDVLMHQDAGVLVIDNVNRTAEVQNGTSWTVSVPGYSIGSPAIANPTNNQFQIQVDSEQPPLIQGGGATRRAIATVEIREIYRGT